jgi:hypothetical protein
MAKGRESRDTWAKRVERWRESGLTANEFAAETGLKAGTLTYWKWKLKSDGAPKQAERRIRAIREPAASEFVEVAVGAPSIASHYEVVSPTGWRVRVPADFDAESLERLLRVAGGL